MVLRLWQQLLYGAYTDLFQNNICQALQTILPDLKSLIFFTAIFVLSNANLDFIVLFLTKNFSFYYIQFALRKGNTISWMKHLAIIFLVCTYLYYGVGIIVIAFISGTAINVNLIIEMGNMILQTIALLLLVFYSGYMKPKINILDL